MLIVMFILGFLVNINARKDHGKKGKFKGILVELRDDGKRIGKIQQFNDTNFREACNGQAVTHKNRDPKNSAKFIFKLDDSEKDTHHLQCL